MPLAPVAWTLTSDRDWPPSFPDSLHLEHIWSAAKLSALSSDRPLPLSSLAE